MLKACEMRGSEKNFLWRVINSQERLTGFRRIAHIHMVCLVIGMKLNPMAASRNGARSSSSSYPFKSVEQEIPSKTEGRLSPIGKRLVRQDL